MPTLSPPARTLTLLLAASCAHPTPRPAPPSPPSSPAAPELSWKQAAERRHDRFVAPPSAFAFHALELQPKPGYVARTLTPEDRQRLSVAGEQIYVSEKPLIDARHARGAHLSAPSDGIGAPDPDVVIEWHPEGRRLVKETTAAQQGRKVAIFVDGRLVSMPLVLERIDSPEIHLFVSGVLSQEDVRRLLRELNPHVDEAAVAVLRKICRDGHTPTCLLVAQESLCGRDMDYDPELAFVAAETACRQRHGAACLEAIKTAAEKKLSSHRDAMPELMRLGCDLGHIASCHAHAMLLLESREPAKESQAQALLNRACDARLGESCYTLAELVMRREGDSARPKAITLAERSCESGYSLACEQLGELALRSTPPDQESALRWLRAACTLAPRQGTYWKPCTSSPEQELEEKLRREAGCPIHPPTDCDHR